MCDIPSGESQWITVFIDLFSFVLIKKIFVGMLSPYLNIIHPSYFSLQNFSLTDEFCFTLEYGLLLRQIQIW